MAGRWRNGGVRAVIQRGTDVDPDFGVTFQGESMEVPQRAEPSGIQPSEQLDESRKIRRLQMMISMVMSVISQDPDLTVEEDSEMAANARRAALAMFPDKELAYDILYRPRLQRLMNERFRLQ
jgi:hypothetical protein